MINHDSTIQGSAKTRERALLPPLPKTRRRLPISWGMVFIVSVIGLLMCYPVALIGSSVVGAVYLKQGNDALIAEDYTSARTNFVSAMGWTDEVQDPYANRLTVAKKTGDFELAIADYTALIKQNPASYLPYCYRAETYRILEQDSLALNDYYSCHEYASDRIWSYASEQAIIVLENRGVTR